MRQVENAIGIVVALGLISAAIWFWWGMSELALDYPTRLAGQMPQYPAEGTFAFYLGCTVALLSSFMVTIFPFGVGFLASVFCLRRLCGLGVDHMRVSPWLGVTVATLSLLPAIRFLTDSSPSFGRFFAEAAWPSLLVLPCRILWPHGLIILSAWGGCVLCGMGIAHSVPAFTLSGLALTTLNCHALYRATH